MFTSTDDGGKRLAIVAEALFLANLLIAPGIAFVALLILWRRGGFAAPSLAVNHLRQTIAASVWGGGLLVGVTALLLFVPGLDRAESLAAAVIWFVSCHGALVIGGALGLARALAGRDYRFPLLGPAEV